MANPINPFDKETMPAFLRTAFVTVAICGLVLLGYWRLMMDHQARAIAELQALNSQMNERLAERQAMIDRLSRSRRLAHLAVVLLSPVDSRFPMQGTLPHRGG